MVDLIEGIRPLTAEFNSHSDRELGIEQTFSVGKDLDNPGQFLYANPLINPRLQQRLDFYNVFFWQENFDSRNYCLLPQNAAVDTGSVLMLYADFAEPSLNSHGKRGEGLALCGFDFGAEVAVGELITDDSPKSLVIGQYQTADFSVHSSVPAEQEMMGYLGFIRYKELLTHIVEQLAWRLHHVHDVALSSVAIAQEMKSDDLAVKNHLKNSLGWVPGGEVRIGEYVNILQKRSSHARGMGYTVDTRIATPLLWSFPALAKPISLVSQDHKLQARFDTIVKATSDLDSKQAVALS